jgi:hypothetical protein
VQPRCFVRTLSSMAESAYVGTAEPLSMSSTNSRLEAMKARLQAAQDSVRVDRLSVFLALTRADDRVVGSVSLPAVLFIQS